MCDNFFNSLELALRLHGRGLALLDMVYKLPYEFLSLEVTSVDPCSRLYCPRYCANDNVVLMLSLVSLIYDFIFEDSNFFFLPLPYYFVVFN